MIQKLNKTKGSICWRSNTTICAGTTLYAILPYSLLTHSLTHSLNSCNEAKKQEIQRLHEQNQELKSENKHLLDEKEELIAEYKHCDRLVTSLQREVAKLNRDHSLTLSELKEKIMKDDVTQALLSDSPPDTNAQIRQIKQQTTARMDEREDCTGVSCLFTGFRLLNLPKKSKHIL